MLACKLPNYRLTRLTGLTGFEAYRTDKAYMLAGLNCPAFSAWWPQGAGGYIYNQVVAHTYKQRRNMVNCAAYFCDGVACKNMSDCIKSMEKTIEINENCMC